MSFRDFKNGEPAKAIFRAMGLGSYLDAAGSWYALRHLIVDFNDKSSGGFVDRARKCDGVASSGERTLLHAVLFATDFAWLADELADGRAWRKMDNVSGAYRRAVAACVEGDA
ncbi:hypothetical protein [Afipia birgiae]|jgi:hypothetical protein|uniref:hypothetical protein n=1 Tax=Afipia birgiae TaxID=151414 RepID=UPI00030ADE91|nr:hypothetical protein [Afipia birgiae]MBX9820051.1 hypothetical protein [Afipia birgiae]